MSNITPSHDLSQGSLNSFEISSIHKFLIMKAAAILEKPKHRLHTLAYAPSLVITLPFEPKTTPKGEIDLILKDALAHATRQLMAEYPRATALPILSKLQQMIVGLNWSTHKKSVALFVSSESEKIMYLEQSLKPQVLVDSSFRIRDLTIDPAEKIQFLVLLLSGRQSKMFRSDGTRLKLIKNNSLKPIYSYYNDIAEPAGNFSDPASRKQVMLDKFLHHMDEGLSIVLNAFPLPVFVIGTKKVLGHFSGLTHNDRHIAVYIHRNCIRAKEQELQQFIQPHLDDWNNLRQKIALKHVNSALEAGKLVTGIEAVSKEVINRNNRLLIVEHNWSEPSGHTTIQPSGKFYLRDRVDGVIEKVLEHGGQVEWVDEGRLDGLNHIALVKYY
jgi:ribosomal protein L7Ae-like RNA K-turn-binding protein